MARGDVFDKNRLCTADVLDRLARHRLRQESNEVAGMTGRHRHADLAVLLHPADAWAVARTRIDDNDWCLSRISFAPDGGTMRTSS